MRPRLATPAEDVADDVTLPELGCVEQGRFPLKVPDALAGSCVSQYIVCSHLVVLLQGKGPGERGLACTSKG